MSGLDLNFEEIHAAFRPKIRRYLERMVGEYEAEDLTQEVFVKVHRALGAFKGDSSVSTWIYRIATNAALDKLRSPSFQRRAELEPLTEDAGPDGKGIAARESIDTRQESSPEAEAFRRQKLECFCGVMETLPANYRAVVALSELGDLAVDEIANILGLNPGAVKMRLHRGRARLLRELKAHCKPEDWL